MRFSSNLVHAAALLLTGSALVASVNADLQEGEHQSQSWKQRLQARKPEVIGRLQSSLHGGLRSRASPTPCNTRERSISKGLEYGKH